MGRGEGNVPARVPILRKGDVLKNHGEAIDERDDRVALGDRQRAARHEIVLQVDEEEDVACAGLQTVVYRRVLGHGEPPTALRPHGDDGVDCAVKERPRAV
jgi:hypothetical protein